MVKYDSTPMAENTLKLVFNGTALERYARVLGEHMTHDSKESLFIADGSSKRNLAAVKTHLTLKERYVLATSVPYIPKDKDLSSIRHVSFMSDTSPTIEDLKDLLRRMPLLKSITVSLSPTYAMRRSKKPVTVSDHRFGTNVLLKPRMTGDVREYYRIGL